VVDGVEGVVEVEKGVHEIDGVTWWDAMAKIVVVDGVDSLAVKGNPAGGERRKRTKGLEIERRRDGFIPRPTGENEEVSCIVVVRPYVEGRRHRRGYVARGRVVGRYVVYELIKVEIIIHVSELVFRFVVFLRLLATIPLLCLNTSTLFAVSALALATSLFLRISPCLFIR
jgi:hypothetical protein